MGTSRREDISGDRGKAIPDYASKIREFRKVTGLTQPQLAAKVKVKRGAVAKWEGGAREPRPHNYLALSDFAKAKAVAARESAASIKVENEVAASAARQGFGLAKNLLSLGEFFLWKTEDKKDKRERTQSEAEAKRYLLGIQKRAAEGGEAAKRLLDLSEIDSTEFAKRQKNRIVEEGKGLSNGELEALLYEIIDETKRVRTLQVGRRCIALEHLRRLERHVEKFESTLAETDKIVRQNQRDILMEAEAALLAGRKVEVIALLQKIPKASIPMMKKLAIRDKQLDRWGKALDVLQNMGPKGADLGSVMTELFEAGALKAIHQTLKSNADTESEDSKK